MSDASPFRTFMKSAIVTGASGGIGLHRGSQEMASLVVVSYAGNPDQAAGGQAVAIQADVAKDAEVESLFKQSKQAFGHVDVVVHCAGIMPMVPIVHGRVAALSLFKSNCAAATLP